MSEQAMRLYNGITNIDDNIIGEAQEYMPQKSSRVWLKWGAAAACVLLALTLALPRMFDTHSSSGSAGSSGYTGSGGSADGFSGDTVGSDAAVDGASGAIYDGNGGAEGDKPLDGSGGTGSVFNGIVPVLRVGGRLYRWKDMSLPTFIDASGALNVDTRPGVETILPEGYTEYGDITSITREMPTEDLQLRAAIEASGTVYTNETQPETVYVRMTTGWFTDQYVRFTSDALNNGPWIAWQGKLYRFAAGYGDISPEVGTLPESCEPIGTLCFIGQDVVPEEDLETNCANDAHSIPLDGREAYADPNDSSRIYIYERQYRREGGYDGWRVCPLWER